MIILSTKTWLPEIGRKRGYLMETIMIMAKALEKASKNMKIDVLSIQYTTKTDEYIGHLLLTLVVTGVWNRTVQSCYLIKSDGSVQLEDDQSEDDND